MKVSSKAFTLAMARACVTPGELSQKAGVGSQCIRNAANGKNLLPATVGKIARALGVDVTEIIENEPED